MIREVERFRAVSDSGTEYTVIVYQDFIDSSSHKDPYAEIPGMKSMFTASGLAVNYIDAKTFKVVETNEVIRKLG